MRFEIWFICSVLLFIASIFLIFAVIWLKKNQLEPDPPKLFLYPCMNCKGEMEEVAQLTENSFRYRCTTCGNEETVYLS